MIAWQALPFWQGLAFTASLLIAIGPQNAHVLRQGLRREWVTVTAATCALCDIGLIALGTGGFGSAIAASRPLLQLTTWGGALFLLAYALRSFVAAWRPRGVSIDHGQADRFGLARAIGLAAALTLLNPLVYVDTLVLVGSFSAQLPAPDRPVFGLGAMSWAAGWFFGLGFGARALASWLARPLTWRVLDAGVGCLSVYLAAVLILRAGHGGP